MDRLDRGSVQSSWSLGSGKTALRLGLVLFMNALLHGCASFSNPVANGVPVRLLPQELLAEPREDKQTIPLTALRQKPVPNYLLAPGDVLGVWIEPEIFADPSVRMPPVIPVPGSKVPPAIGLPIPVRDDGTLPLPQVEPVSVTGMTLKQAEEAIRQAYTVKNKLLKPGSARIYVTLFRPRQYHILVIRQDTGSAITVGGGGLLGNTKRGTGYSIDLPAYENDVLNALAQSGGLPGVDAVNEILIERGVFSGVQDSATLLNCYGAGGMNFRMAPGAGGVTRIPVRMRPGDPLPFRSEDVVLNTGDIVFIEERTTEVWYSGGVLPPGEHFLPRDRDLDVVQAIAQVGFDLVSPGVTGGSLAGTIIAPGIGTPSPSLLAVIRRTPAGGQVPIRVDVNRALRDPRERLLLQPGDIVILQETPTEAFLRYLTQKFSASASWQFLHQAHETGTATGVVP